MLFDIPPLGAVPFKPVALPPPIKYDLSIPAFPPRLKECELRFCSETCAKNSCPHHPARKSF